MSSYNLKRFTSPKTLQSVSPEVLIEFLGPHREFIAGRGFSLPKSDGTISDFDYLMLTSILMTPDEGMPRDLIDALYFTHEMGGDRTIDGLLDVARQIGLEIPPLSTPMDIAMRIWTADRSALEKKHSEQHIYRSRTFEHYQADKLLDFVEPSEDQLTLMQQSLDEWFTAHKRGGSTRVFVYPGDGEVWFLIRHGDAYKRESAVDGYRSRSIFFRPESFDVACYVPAQGELRIHCKNKSERNLYRREFGRLIAGDTGHFPGLDKYSLNPLMYDGEQSLVTRDIEGIDWIMLTELKLKAPTIFCPHTITYSGPDVFAVLRHRGEVIRRNDTIVKARFQVKFTGEDKPRSVAITPPNKMQLSRDGDADLLELWLSARGFVTNTEVYEDDKESEDFLVGM